MRPPTEDEMKKIEAEWQLACNGCKELTSFAGVDVMIIENEVDMQNARDTMLAKDSPSTGVAMCRDGTKFLFNISKDCPRCHDEIFLERPPADLKEQPDVPLELLKFFTENRDKPLQ